MINLIIGGWRRIACSKSAFWNGALFAVGERYISLKYLDLQKRNPKLLPVLSLKIGLSPKSEPANIIDIRINLL